MKFVVAEFALYALAAFVVGATAGATWQRRPIRRATDRVRRLERAKLSSDQRCARAERERDAIAADLEEARGLLGSVSQLRASLAESITANHAAVAARQAAELHVTQLRADLDARTFPAFVQAAERWSPTDQQNADEEARNNQRELDSRLELVRRNEALNASLTERLHAADRHLRDLQHRHNSYVRSAQAALTAAVVRAEQAEANLSVALSARNRASGEAAVIDLRVFQPARATQRDPA